jgi:hypothetical protein
MSLEEQDDQLEDFPFQSLKANQNTTICVRQRKPSDEAFEHEVVTNPADCSF